MNTLQYSRPTETIPETAVHISEESEDSSIQKSKLGFGTARGTLVTVSVIVSFHFILSVIFGILSYRDG